MSEPGIPLSDLDYGAEEEQAVLEVLRRRWLSTGPEVAAFEAGVAGLLGVRHAVAVANGTAALHLALLALGIGPGDEVIQPAINFVAAANVTRATGATPVLADIVGIEEPVLDPAELERRLTPRTRAVVVMHYGGYATRLEAVAEFCRARGLFLIEDACHAIGGRTRPDGPMSGSLGDIACFSFFSNKNLAIGEGGMVTTDNPELLAAVTKLRSHGMTSLSWERHRGHASGYDVTVHGYNYRMDDVRAALGRAQLAKLLPNNEKRRELTRLYRRLLAEVPGLVLPFREADIAASACHLMPVVAPSAAARDAMAEALKAQGIQSSRHYPAISGFTAFAEAAGNRLPHSIDYAGRTLTLPLFPTMTEAQVRRVAEAVTNAMPAALAA
ncbi:DegT/DnrJ/EryC1/StrS family aminotransferase [Siccirubricoccus sp. KC 17139]|uniref:DegT/DnrJ/EryC1/StrS family aminotransferase n=1 Tax=Siccirubricoccus soli TaxID=2899147 RepID=A0ABT1D8Z5_9PROT|nr:DegT/DnrJ/EryC1/StrS family aminotransferase [Siccirubricoccus soli]MCO6418407.1 DegT/DnrJ/EryC1/StrS family aminotransferase [Siccirubricoccus soli]MCP2684542.1 DegT/DnrJ/EryC1/StrS family aminotransferase [Siccirubricoccus soli]